jgi:hypothetical protein
VRLGREFELVVNRPKIDGPFTVSIHESIDKALPIWGPATRASPLFASEGSQISSLSGRSITQIGFVGPISPDELPSGLNLYLSYGLYNVVIFANTKAERQALDAFLGRLSGLAWECWELVGNQVRAGSFAPMLHKTVGPTQAHSRSALLGDVLRAAGEEYRTLLAVTRARSSAYLKGVADDMDVLDKALSDKVKNIDLHAVRKLQWLLSINAALSRFSSQTFAGTSPILGTECHFWTHSLLGVGIATKALLNVRRYVDKRATLAQFPSRIEAFKKKDAQARHLWMLPTYDNWWSQAELPDLPTGGAQKPSAAQLPLIVYFSGRDGFKSTAFTLSAPLEVLQSANTCAWSLQTLTHELSHIFVDSIVGALLEDDYKSPVWSRKVIELYDGTRTPANLHEQLQELLFFGLARLEMENMGRGITEINLTVDAPKTLIEKYFHVLSELYAHIFDYLHFFQQNPTSYINFVWSSWDVIPSIESRVTDYIIRSLCALHIGNLSVNQGIDATIDTLTAGLATLSKAASGSDQYVRLAAKQLEQRRKEFAEMLEVRLPLIKLARVLMYSPTVSSYFAHTRPASKRAAKRFSGHKAKQFAKNRTVDNPIRFILDHCGDRKPDAAKSLWVLTHLAFSVDSDD